MKRKMLAITLTLLLLGLSSIELGSIKLGASTSDAPFPSLSMPIEYINYTITALDGSLWAVVDGDYPIYLSSQPDYDYIDELPIVYPMPPNTTNIHVYLANKELIWTNYTQTYPDQLHHTAIGDWWMIHSTLSNVSEFFELNIHYEHPLQSANGHYMFLYDLNIDPYLSEQNNNSTCIYTIRFDVNIKDFQAYTAETDDKWNPIDFNTTKEGLKQTFFIHEYSEYNKPLLGDLIVQFSSAPPSQTPSPNQKYFEAVTVTIGLSTLFLLATIGLILIFRKIAIKSKNHIKQLPPSKT
jgi:hypothetical protein